MQTSLDTLLNAVTNTSKALVKAHKILFILNNCIILGHVENIQKLEDLEFICIKKPAIKLNSGEIIENEETLINIKTINTFVMVTDEDFNFSNL